MRRGQWQDPLRSNLEILGPGCALIPCVGKVPKLLAWQKTKAAQMDRVYVSQLDRSKGNIGVVLGSNSHNLCAVDLDSDEEVEPFLEENPTLRRSARIRGARGCKIFVRVTGDYPSKTKLKRNGEEIGDWLADGSQAIVDGKHPDGALYHWECMEPPVEIRFSELHLEVKKKRSAPITSSELLNSEHTELLNNIRLQDELRASLRSKRPFFQSLRAVC